jgi:hypothetical protein
MNHDIEKLLALVQNPENFRRLVVLAAAMHSEKTASPELNSLIYRVVEFCEKCDSAEVHCDVNPRVIIESICETAGGLAMYAGYAAGASAALAAQTAEINRGSLK